MSTKPVLSANILFAGIGCQERGIENAELFDFKVNCISEINEKSVLSYAAIHNGMTPEMVETYDYPSVETMVADMERLNLGYTGTEEKAVDWHKVSKEMLQKYWLACKLSNNLGDIKAIESLPYADLWTCSFPCTDVSLAGAMKGLNPDSETRSSLLWDCVRLLKKAKEDDKLPKFILIENVKNLVGRKFISDFYNLRDVFEELGFNAYWDILNASGCGIPQTRQRVFLLLINQAIDTNTFTFPVSFECENHFIDLLQRDADESFLVSADTVKRVIRLKNSDTALCYDASMLGMEEGSREYDSFCPTLTARDYKDPRYININAIEAYDTNQPVKTPPKLRKMTPCEYYRLMGMEFEDCESAAALGVSNKDLYMQAGNGIVTNCVTLIMEHLYKAIYDETYYCSDENRL